MRLPSAGGATVVSAHGVALVVHQEAQALASRRSDAIFACDQVHREAVRFAGDDYDILPIGHEGIEVIGTSGEAPEEHARRRPDDV